VVKAGLTAGDLNFACCNLMFINMLLFTEIRPRFPCVRLM